MIFDYLKNSKKRLAAITAMAVSVLFLSAWSVQPAISQAKSWEQIDRDLKARVYHINVAIKIKLKDGSFAMLSDFSPKYRRPVFAAYDKDFGYRVVGFGTSFPVVISRGGDTYFITNHHVVASHLEVMDNCKKFFAAMRLYAEQTASGGDVEERFSRLRTIVSLPSAKQELNTAERVMYSQTVDGIWDCYQTYLSPQTEQGRALFNKYAKESMPIFETGYFLHPPGPATQRPLQASLYKACQNGRPDLAILVVKKARVTPIELDTISPSEGQEIQAIGYPTASDALDEDSSKYFAPTFNTGRISRVTPKTLQVDASVTTGMSGGPLVNRRGKVVGVVSMRFKNKQGAELTSFSGAVKAQLIKEVAPELFDNLSTATNSK